MTEIFRKSFDRKVFSRPVQILRTPSRILGTADEPMKSWWLHGFRRLSSGLSRLASFGPPFAIGRNFSTKTPIWWCRVSLMGMAAWE